ncbi:MAG: hypothetical protein K9H49_11380 [Bacteroidales bacterium]|nr:hypothetical protein [Bacteroidales bacterium]MCF8390020.1 hypothetical protein [Bacteroidales bacterium]
MKTLNFRLFLASFLILVFFSFSISSCATSRKSRIDAQRRGLMLQDKSEYATNKGKYKGSSSFKKQKKRSKKLNKNRRKGFN